MKLLLISIFFSAVCYGQKDSTQKTDTAVIIMNEYLLFLQDKITVKDYMPIQKTVTLFLKQREFLKPKKK